VSQSSILSQERSASPKVRRRTLTREIIETAVLTLLIFFAVHYSVQPYRVDGPSMQPGLVSDCDALSPKHCERVLVNLLAYDFSTPARGDVIVFHPPTSNDPNLYYVKRIIAVPGDTIEITPSSVLVNGVTLKEPYIAGYGKSPIAGDETVSGCTAGLAPTVLGKGEYWVMGDNRTDSVDSRCFGPIARQSIVGKADAIVWPFDSIKWLPDYSGVFASAAKAG
jgi:signal peptidase I